jgi:hypothetical protein
MKKSLLYASHKEARDVKKCDVKSPLMAASHPQETLLTLVEYMELDTGSERMGGRPNAEQLPFNQGSHREKIGQGTGYVLPSFSSFPQALWANLWTEP